MITYADQLYDEGFYTTTGTCGNKCKHLNGWYGRIKFNLFLFELHKNVFACSDCGKILQDKELRKFEKRRN